MALQTDKIWIKGYSKRYDENIGLAIIPKNGSTSFRNALGTNETFTNSEILNTSKRVAFVRHPQERLISCWSFFYMLNDTDQNGRLKDVPKSVTHKADGSPDYEAFIDHVLSVDNMHWHPQALLLGDTPNRYFRFSDLDNVWQHFFDGHAPNMNKSRKRATSEYRADELKAKYADDIALFRSTAKVSTPMFTKPTQAAPWW